MTRTVCAASLPSRKPARQRRAGVRRRLALVTAGLLVLGLLTGCPGSGPGGTVYLADGPVHPVEPGGKKTTPAPPPPPSGPTHPIEPRPRPGKFGS